MDYSPKVAWSFELENELKVKIESNEFLLTV